MGAKEQRILYFGYCELANKLPGGQREIFRWIEVIAQSIRYVLTQMVAWEISRRRSLGPWGDWFASEKLIEQEFLVEEIGRFEQEIFFLLALKCAFLRAYEYLRERYGGLPCLYEVAAPQGYVDDARALEIILGLEPEQLAFLAEAASKTSTWGMDFLFYFGGEVDRLLENYKTD